MKSITKFQVTHDRIRAVFNAAGIGAVSEIAEISDGWYNSVFSAVDKDGKKYVLKIAPQKSVKVLTHERNLMASEVNFYRLLSEKTAIKTPKIAFADFSESIIPTPYFIMDFLSGERLDKTKLTPSEKEEVNEQWAWILSEFHKIKGAGYGYDQAGLCDNWKDGLTHMTQILIDDAASFGKKCAVGKKLLLYIDRFSDALKNVSSVFVNFDLHPMNLFCEKTPDGIRLSVLDLERGFWGDPIGDFIMPEGLKNFAKKGIVPRYNRYAAAPIDTGAEEKIRYHLLTVYLATVMYTERFSRFKGFGKFFNITYLAGTVGYKIFAKISFSALKRLSK
ncbi:MAG: aminoglycoside phosphotransferase family protein, partial [Clostridiales bacterium]|jgi:aminoglycoside phosphotransferase (APT) family kinase protein|nr:aminoglycoside phosphotransferase family protein [Clostridiales bacterium]